MRTDNKHIDQSSELSALRNEVSDLKAMMSIMQEIIMTQNKQISDIHIALFNSPVKSKQALKIQKKDILKSSILLNNVKNSR